MLSRLATLQLLLSFFVSFAAAQEALLTTGIGSLPTCALQCLLLNQAAGACRASAQPWSCFCSYGALTSLTTTPAGICDSFCPVASDNAGVQTWYLANCGTDKGASEHPAGATTTTTGTGATTTTTGAATTASGSSASGSFVPVGVDPATKGSWWDGHAKWVIMLIVIAFGLAALTFLLLWLKRRHARKQDAVVGGFNEGITMRSTPMTTVADPAPVHNSSGRDSPIRTRDAFMPYGYGYSRSDSRLGSRTHVGDPQPRGSPLAHDGTTLAELEKSAQSGASGKKKRVYVRERSISGRDSPEERR